MAMAEPAGGAKKALVVSSSPRRDGNSRLLADAAFAGAREAGHSAELVHLDDHLGAFLRDCRVCRSAAGYCTVEDGFDALYREKFLPAGGRRRDPRCALRRRP
jgi:multimeric flavodoxin WrbA